MKHNVYQHTEPDFCQKFKHKLSIPSALNLPDQIKLLQLSSIAKLIRKS